MSPRDLIVQQALALPLEDQVFVVEALEDHLCAQIPPESDAWSASELQAELDRRVAAYERGETQALDVDEALAELERREAKDARP